MIPPVEQLAAMAERLQQGLLVGVAPAEQVYELRRVCLNYVNVMFVPEDPEGGIPWRDEFFSKVFAPGLEEPGAEIRRVLAPGGQVIR